MFSNCVTQLVLLMLPLLSVPGFLVHISLCSAAYFCLCAHSRIWGYGITECASLVQFTYGTFKSWRLGYNIYHSKVFVLSVVSTDDTWSGAELTEKSHANELVTMNSLEVLGKRYGSALWIRITSDLCIAPLCFLPFGDLKLHLVQLSNWDIKSRSWFSKSVQGCKINSWFINIHLAIL